MDLTNNKDDIKIDFGLINVEKLKFFENDPDEIKFDENKKNEVNTVIHTEIEVNIINQTIGITLEIYLKSIVDTDIDLFGIKTRHLYKIKNIESIVKKVENDNFNIPDNFLATLISIAYSGTRGMLVILITNNKYRKIFLPLVQPTKLLPKKKEN